MEACRLIASYLTDDGPAEAGLYPDPWLQIEYREWDGERYGLSPTLYGVAARDRAGADKDGADLSIDPWAADLYRTGHDGFAQGGREPFEDRLRAQIASAGVVRKRDLVLAAARFSALAKHAVSPEREGPFSLPGIPLPADDEMDLGYRLNDVIRHRILGANEDAAQEAAELVAEQGDEVAFVSIERAFVSAELPPFRRTGWLWG